MVPDAVRYTPKHLAGLIINSNAALEGERKQVTVLFADLKGSMELHAKANPAKASGEKRGAPASYHGAALFLERRSDIALMDRTQRLPYDLDQREAVRQKLERCGGYVAVT